MLSIERLYLQKVGIIWYLLHEINGQSAKQYCQHVVADIRDAHSSKWDMEQSTILVSQLEHNNFL